MSEHTYTREDLEARVRAIEERHKKELQAKDEEIKALKKESGSALKEEEGKRRNWRGNKMSKEKVKKLPKIAEDKGVYKLQNFRYFPVFEALGSSTNCPNFPRFHSHIPLSRMKRMSENSRFFNTILTSDSSSVLSESQDS